MSVCANKFRVMWAAEMADRVDLLCVCVQRLTGGLELELLASLGPGKLAREAQTTRPAAKAKAWPQKGRPIRAVARMFVNQKKQTDTTELNSTRRAALSEPSYPVVCLAALSASGNLPH